MLFHRDRTHSDPFVVIDCAQEKMGCFVANKKEKQSWLFYVNLCILKWNVKKIPYHIESFHLCFEVIAKETEDFFSKIFSLYKA